MVLSSSKILIVDDNEGILKSLSFILREEYSSVDTLKNPNRLSSELRDKSWDLILLDMNFSAGINTGNEGIFWLREILKIDPDAIVIMITAYGDIDLAVKAMKEGAADFIQKPFDIPRLLVTINSALKLGISRKEVKSLKGKQKQLSHDIDRSFRLLHGESPAMKELMSTLRKVAVTDASVLILGENGTGKEVIARELHRLSNRSEELFIPVDLGAVSETLFESELFGHKKGSFTDAREDRIGRFEAASGGTLFLDEIGNLPLSHQAKILTVLQNGEVIPVGSNQPVNINIRLVSATNKRLNEMIRNNLFREDLLFRINTIQIEIPPLRQRVEDILPLADYFLGIYGRKYDKHMVRLSSDAVNRLLRHSWPGNVRELQHIIENAVIMSDDSIIRGSDLRFTARVDKDQPGLPETLNLNDIEKVAVREALMKHNGNINQAALELGITRKTLYSKIKRYGL